MTRPGDLRKKIIKKKGLNFSPYTKDTVTVDELPADYTKTNHMKYLELKFNKPIHKIIYEGGIDSVAAKYGIDRTTVSKWRKRIASDQADKAAEKFFQQFNSVFDNTEL